MTSRAIWLSGIVFVLLTLLAPLPAAAAGVRAPLDAGTLVLDGTMSSTVVMTMSGAFSVGHASNLSWDLPRPESLAIDGYSEDVQSVTYQFDVQPDSFQNLSVNGHPVRQFHWDNPPNDAVIHVTETLHVAVVSSLTAFHSDAAYPLSPVPPDVAPYLTVTPLLQLPASADHFVHQFAGGKTTERAVVTAVADWVASHVHYAGTTSTADAAWVLSHRQADCGGYVDAMAGILRSLGIPSQVEYGWVSAAPFRLPGPHNLSTIIQWASPRSSGGLHTWLDVYFPGSGWVPFDPQREKFFVDPRHVAFLTNVDAGDPKQGTWSAYSQDGRSPTGATLSNGSVAIVPGDGIRSVVTVHNLDHFQLRVRQVRHDVKNTLLISR